MDKDKRQKLDNEELKELLQKQEEKYSLLQVPSSFGNKRTYCNKSLVKINAVLHYKHMQMQIVSSCAKGKTI